MKAKNDGRREKYDQKMKLLGFSKIHPWVHKDDREEILKFIEVKREARLKKSKN